MNHDIHRDTLFEILSRLFGPLNIVLKDYSVFLINVVLWSLSPLSDAFQVGYFMRLIFVDI